MILGALLSVAVAIILLVAALLPGGGPPLAALSLAADAVAGTCLTLALRKRRRRSLRSGHLPNGPDTSGPRSEPTPVRSGHFPQGASPRA
jgi:hypothetical protein